MRLRVAFRTLGCKLNQLETESLADAFARSGAEIAGVDDATADPECPSADLLVLNTCTVTSKAEQKARRILRRALSEGACSAALVTGCYAQVDAASLEAINERAVVVPGDDKDTLLCLPGWLAENWDGHGDLLEALREWRGGDIPRGGRFAFEPALFAFHSRPSLKVQDGCDNRCAYCRVCLARGPSVGLDPDLAISRARALEASGKAEIVLTGVNLSQYRAGGLDFPALLRRLVEGTERVAFRLSSYEPDRIDGRFLEAFAHPRLRPHLHLAVQSGSDPILGAMGRRYGRDEVLGAVRALRAAKGDPFIGADLIVGFPGETEEDAADTLELARSCEFAWIHAFRFSPRPGTRAAGMSRPVPERVAGDRARALADLARRGREAYVARWVGSEVEAVLEGPSSGEGAGGEPSPPGGPRYSRYATSENYLKLRLESAPEGAAAGRSIACRIGAEVRSEPGADCDAEYLHYI